MTYGIYAIRFVYCCFRDWYDVLDHIDLNKYLTSGKRRTGKPRYDEEALLKIILFAFMEDGYVSTRKIEKLCRTDIRYMWLLNDNPPPSHMTIANFMNNVLKENIEEIFADINAYIFEEKSVDTNHCYIDGTKIEANANKYSWVWKKNCQRNIQIGCLSFQQNNTFQHGKKLFFCRCVRYTMFSIILHFSTFYILKKSE